MCTQKASIILSHSREVSDIHFCLQGLLPVHSLPHFGYDFNILWHFPSIVILLSFHTIFRHLASCFFLADIPCNATTCEFRYLPLGNSCTFFCPHNSCRKYVFCVHAPRMTHDLACAACPAVQLQLGMLFASSLIGSKPHSFLFSLASPMSF